MENNTEEQAPQQSVLKEYAENIRAFSPNARFYLWSAVAAGAAMGIFRLLFNWYLLSLGHDDDLIGNLITASNTTALIVALPMGLMVDKWGRKYSLLIRSLILTGAIVAMALIPTVTNFYIMNILFGVAMSIGSVAMGPFLMENSSEKERAYLFSIASGLRMASVSVGNWIGGYMPTWVGNFRGVDVESPDAYAGALLLVGVFSVLGIIPILMIRRQKLRNVREGVFAPVTFARENPKMIGKLYGPLLIVSIGAGLFVPFMNVYFREVHNQPDPVIGSLMAWGSLAMGVGLVIAPPLANRMGKLRLVVLTQGLSIPFMIMLGFVPVFWIGALAYYVRMALMNMSSPIYQNFVLEQVKAKDRATVASLHAMVWSFGRSFSPSVSGNLQVAYGFGPPFLIAIVLYAVAIFLYWLFWLRKKAGGKRETVEVG